MLALLRKLPGARDMTVFSALEARPLHVLAVLLYREEYTHLHQQLWCVSYLPRLPLRVCALIQLVGLYMFLRQAVDSCC